jgi:hypothetical protein
MGKQDAVSGGLLGQLGVKNIPFSVHFLHVIQLAHKLSEIWLFASGVLLGSFVEEPGYRYCGQGAPEGRLYRNEEYESVSFPNGFGSEKVASPPSARHLLRPLVSENGHHARRSDAGGEPPRH